MHFVYIFFYALTSALSLSQGLFVLRKNPRSRINITWALLSFAVAIWALEGSLFLFSSDNDKALLGWRISNYSAMWIPVFFSHFCLALVNRPLRKSLPTMFGYFACAISSSCLLSRYFIPSVPTKLIFTHYADAGPIYTILMIQFFVLVCYSHWTLFRFLPEQKAERQNQIRYVATATIIGFVCGSTTFPLVYDVPLNPWPSLFTFVYATIITYAIVKHQLMDIRVVIRKSLAYSLLIACITATYFVSVLMMERWFQGFFGYRSLIATVIVAFLITVFFNPVRSRIQAFVDRALFKGTPVELAAQREQLLVEVRKTDQMRAVATLAAGLAHEIRNPLTSIKTFTEYLGSHYDDAEFRAKFQKIVGGEVERINLITQQLLDFAKPQPPKLQPVRLATLLDETLELLNKELVERHVTVERDYQTAGEIQGDARQLKQVLLNLALNSLQAMNGDGRLRVAIARQGDDVALSIADNGCGIPADQLPHIFDPFYTSKPNGTGLGLSIVQGIVAEHGGRIEVKSQPQGTCMAVLFPKPS